MANDTKLNEISITLNEAKKYKAVVKSQIVDNETILLKIRGLPPKQGKAWQNGMIRHYEDVIYEKQLELDAIGTIITTINTDKSKSATIRKPVSKRRA